MPKHKMSSDQYKSNWFRGDKLHLIFLYYVQHLTLTFHFTLSSMVIKHRVIQDIIYNREGFNTTIFKLTLNEMFLCWAVGQNRTRSQRLCRILFLLPDSVPFLISIWVWLSPDRIRFPSVRIPTGDWFSPDHIRFRSVFDSDWITGWFTTWFEIP